MHNDTTVALLFVIAALSAFTVMNKLILRHPIVASIAALGLTLGPMLIYVGLHQELTWIL